MQPSLFDMGPNFTNRTTKSVTFQGKLDLPIHRWYRLTPSFSPQLAHDIAVHIAFAKPQYLRREDVPADAVEEERRTLLDITKAEGKPEAAWPKIVEGRLNGWYKERVLLEQPFVRDEKQTVAQLADAGEAQIVSYAQLFIGG